MRRRYEWEIRVRTIEEAGGTLSPDWFRWVVRLAVDKVQADDEEAVRTWAADRLGPTTDGVYHPADEHDCPRCECWEVGGRFTFTTVLVGRTTDEVRQFVRSVVIPQQTVVAA